MESQGSKPRSGDVPGADALRFEPNARRRPTPAACSGPAATTGCAPFRTLLFPAEEPIQRIPLVIQASSRVLRLITDAPNSVRSEEPMDLRPSGPQEHPRWDRRYSSRAFHPMGMRLPWSHGHRPAALLFSSSLTGLSADLSVPSPNLRERSARTVHFGLAHARMPSLSASALQT